MKHGRLVIHAAGGNADCSIGLVHRAGFESAWPDREAGRNAKPTAATTSAYAMR
jgi:hypothetical protein